MNRYLLIACLLTFHLICSCTDDSDIATYTTSTGRFTHSLLLEGIVEPIRSTSIIAPRNCDGIVQFLVEDGVYVEEGQVVCIIEYQELKNQYDQLLIGLENAIAGFNKTKADLAMQFALLEAEVRTNEANTKIAQMDSLQIAFASSRQRAITALELEKAAIERTRFEKKLEALKIIQQSEIKKWELEIQRFQLRVTTMKEQLDALTLKAPHNGVIIRSICLLTDKKYQVGDPIWSSMAVATMPEFKEMKIKILSSEADFKSISVNDSVYYTFDAMPGNRGSGKIVKKAPVGKPYKRGGMVKFFEVEASLELVDSLPDPGFTANCHVIMKQVDSVISIPQIALFEEDSLKVVFVQQKRGFERREVQTGVSSQKEMVITAGLSQGEIVTLSKPKVSEVKKHTPLPLPDSLKNPSNL